VLSQKFHVLYVGATSGIDLIGIIAGGENNAINTTSDLKHSVEAMEEDLISLFLSDEYLGKIQKQVDIFQNPFKTFIEFSVGYAFLRSSHTDDIVEAVKIAAGRAEMRKRIKIDELTEELFYIIDNGDVETYFQPIVDIRDKRVFAHEALVRGPENSKLRSPALLFKIAHLSGMEMDLDRVVRRIHIRNFKTYMNEHSDALLAINLGPFTSMFVDEIDGDLGKSDIPKEQVIWEVSEKTYIDDFVAFSRVIDFLVSAGYKVAVDDFGAGATTFKLIFSIYTHIVKIDRSFINDIGNDNAKKCFSNGS
jgi:EAL domain-containing protein (putative c-di-GMP-specific phosphodiesterase class I)